MASGTAKAALFDALASVSQALGSGRRAEIVDVLAQGERSVDELAGEISQSVANTSQHLQVLARAGLVRSRREGTRIIYRLASDRVAELWAAVRDVAVRHVAEVSVLADEYLGERDGVEQLSADELARRLERGDVVVLDVRPEASSAQVTSRARARRRCRRSTRWRRHCRSGGRWSPTAAARTASTPTTPCACSAAAV